MPTVRADAWTTQTARDNSMAVFAGKTSMTPSTCTRPSPIPRPSGRSTCPETGSRAFPTQVFDMKSLRDLRISRNQIVEIPDEIGELVNLEYLYAAANPLKKVSSQIGSIIPLYSLSLEFTERESSAKNDYDVEAIISDLARLENLGQLCIVDPALSKFPYELLSFKQLTYLNLEGRIDALPESVDELCFLDTLHIDHNNLEALPESNR